MNRLGISVLGSPRIEVDGRPVQVDTRKAIALLAFLATTGRTQSRERLAGLLWPDYDEERARAALRRTLSTLKKALGDRWIEADRLGVSLGGEGIRFDLGTLRDAIGLAASHDHGREATCSECMDTLTAAVELAGGRFLQGFSLRDADPFEEWQMLEAENAERDLVRALDKLVHAHTAAGDLDAAATAARRKLDLDPLDEPTHRQLMQVYAWRGMRGAALQQYRECVAILDRELGVPPLPETTSLYHAIGEGAVETRVTEQLPAPSSRVVAGQPSQYPLRGRAAELDALVGIYLELDRSGALASIVGEAGIGKTRMAEELLEVVRGRGGKVIAARSHEGETGLPYALVTRLLEQLDDGAAGDVSAAALTEASRLVAALRPEGATPGPIDDPGGITRFLEGIRVVLAASVAGTPHGVVFVDDLQRCDAASLEALTYVARRLDETPLLLLAAWRPEEIDQEHALRGLMAVAGGSRSVALERLGEDDVRALVNDATELADDELVKRLMEETEGIPFFLVEYLAVVGEGAGQWQLPTSVKELLESRLDLVGPTARQVLGTAAVIDRSFDFDTVWRASGRTELEVVDALEELVAHRLVLAGTGGASTEALYEFSHEKLRTFVYDALSPARRKVLHRRVAESLALSASGDRDGAVAALVARHFELGGMGSEAALNHEKAAAYARSISANRAALEHYRAALALDHPNRIALHEGAGDMLVLLGDYREAVDDYQAAAAQADPRDVPRLEFKLGGVHLRRGDWDLSHGHLVMALEMLGVEGDERLRPRILAAMSFNAYRKGELDEAVDLGLRSLEAATSSDDPLALAHARNQQGILENARGHFGEAESHLRESVRLATELGDENAQAAALNNLAQTARLKGALEESLALTRDALEICSKLGDSHREAALHNNLADVLHKLGDSEGAMQELKTATAVLAKIGDEPTGMLPEVWKLVEW